MTQQIKPRTILRALVPGMIVPVAVYGVCSQFLSTLSALSVAALVPVADLAVATAKGKRLNLASVGFVGMAVVSVTLAVTLHSPALILIKPAVVAGLAGLAFGLSALLRRPLTRTLAIRFSGGDDHELQAELRRQWHHPKATRIFRTIAFGWAVWLLISAARTLVVASIMPPATAFMIEAPSGPATAAIGALVTILYVRRFRHTHPELGLWFASTPAT
jgi:intracellular septation protein A